MDVTFLQILLYVLGAVLMVCLIVLIIKIIYTVNRINFLLDNIERKVRSLDKIFNAIDHFSDSFSMATDKVVNGLLNLANKIFKKKKKEREDN